MWDIQMMSFNKIDLTLLATLTRVVNKLNLIFQPKD